MKRRSWESEKEGSWREWRFVREEKREGSREVRPLEQISWKRIMMECDDEKRWDEIVKVLEVFKHVCGNWRNGVISHVLAMKKQWKSVKEEKEKMKETSSLWGCWRDQMEEKRDHCIPYSIKGTEGEKMKTIRWKSNWDNGDCQKYQREGRKENWNWHVKRGRLNRLNKKINGKERELRWLRLLKESGDNDSRPL